MTDRADPDIDRLVGQLSSGDPGAVHSLLGRYLSDLTEYVQRHTGLWLAGKEPPADIVQSVCREVLEGVARGGFEYRGEPQFRQWLYQAALHKIQMKGRHYRAQRRDVRREVTASDGSGAAGLLTSTTPSGVAADQEEQLRFRAALEQLDEQQRRIVEWAHLEGLAHRVIAERLGVTETHSRVLLSRALARLARIANPDA